jgi:glycosyltransferase involved in cell wall biosynthesis/peptidoglycan/xylan/chitin deacetylase (PgdA/CDA1 family)
MRMNIPQPAVSVIIPCFNLGATLDEAVDSVLNQTFQNFEIVIVNDGSTDSQTNSLLKNYRRPKTKIITTENHGLAHARRTAIRNSTGKYILPLDADDKISSEYLSMAVQILESNDNAIIVYCDAEYFGDESGRMELPEFSLNTMLFRNLIFCAAFFRRADYEKTRGYGHLPYAHEDWDLWLSLLELRPGGEVHKIPGTHFHYRKRADSMLGSMTEAEHRRSRLQIFLNHLELYERYGIEPIGLQADLQEYKQRYETLERQYAALDSKYREVRDSDEYRFGRAIHKPWAAILAAAVCRKFELLKRFVLGDDRGWIKAYPNPVRPRSDSRLQKAVVYWGVGKANAVEIHVDAPDGPLFVRAAQPGCAVTGKWVRCGTVFYLQDISGGLPLTASNTLAVESIGTRPDSIPARTGRTLKRALNAARSQRGSSGLILMYHRVQKLSDPWGLNVRPEYFAEHLEVIRRYGRPWPLGRAVHALQQGALPPRTIVITFDDGYRDNLLSAKPLLEQHDIPATLFLTTGSIEGKSEFWWDELERILLQTETLPRTLQLMMRQVAGQWELSDASSSRLRLYYELHERLQPLTHNGRQDIMNQLRLWAGVNSAVRESHQCLSREDVIELHRGGLFEIGSHTVTHPLLTSLPAESQRTEIQDGKSELENILGHEVTGFAYPYGQCTTETLELVRAAGFLCGCSVASAIVAPDADPFNLPRVKVEDWDGERFGRWLSDWFKQSA